MQMIPQQFNSDLHRGKFGVKSNPFGSCIYKRNINFSIGQLSKLGVIQIVRTQSGVLLPNAGSKGGTMNFTYRDD